MKRTTLEDRRAAKHLLLGHPIYLERMSNHCYTQEDKAGDTIRIIKHNYKKDSNCYLHAWLSAVDLKICLMYERDIPARYNPWNMTMEG